MGRGVYFATGAAWWGSVTHLQPPCADRLAVPVSHILLPSCMAWNAWIRGVTRRPLVLLQCGFWLASSAVPGCALSVRCSALERS